MPEITEKSKQSNYKLNKEQSPSFEVSHLSSWYASEVATDVKTLKYADYKAMYLNDSRIFANWNFIKNLVKSVPFTIESYTESDLSNEMALFVEDTFSNLLYPIENAFSQIMDAMIFGYSIAEKIYIKSEKGQFVLNQIKGKPGDKFSIIHDQFGNIKELVYDYQGAEEKKLYIPKFVVASYPDPNTDNGYFGKSILIPLYHDYLRKKYFKKFIALAIELNAVPILAVNILYDLIQGDPAKLEEINDMVDNIRSNSILKIPAILDENGKVIPQVEVKMIESDYQDDNFQFVLDVIREIDKSFDIAFQIPLDLRSEGGGSYAKSKVQKGLLGDLIADSQKFLEEIFNTQVITQLIDLNYSEQAIKEHGYPTLSFQKSDNFDPDRVNLIEKFITLGVIDSSEAWIREEFGIVAKEQIETDEGTPELTPTEDIEETQNINME